jgi:hypothetical protein
MRNQLLVNETFYPVEEYSKLYKQFMGIDENSTPSIPYKKGTDKGNGKDEDENMNNTNTNKGNEELRKFLMKLLGINTRKACDRMKKSIIVDIVNSEDELRNRAGDKFEKLTINKICNKILGPEK